MLFLSGLRVRSGRLYITLVGFVSMLIVVAFLSPMDCLHIPYHSCFHTSISL